jgi:hypothetical protein
MPAVVDLPAHISADRVVDFDYLAPEGHEQDVHRAWNALHAPGIPDVVWTPHYGGHWIATRAADIPARIPSRARGRSTESCACHWCGRLARRGRIGRPQCASGRMAHAFGWVIWCPRG